MKTTVALASCLLYAGLAHAQDIQSERTVGMKIAAEMAATAVDDCSSRGA